VTVQSFAFRALALAASLTLSMSRPGVSSPCCLLLNRLVIPRSGLLTRSAQEAPDVRVRMRALQSYSAPRGEQRGLAGQVVARGL